jgi:hypothetical protein
MRLRSVVLAAVTVVALPGASAGAWTPQLAEAISRDARRLIPKTLAILMGQREPQIRQEWDRFPPELTAAMARDLQTGALSAGTLALLDAYAAEPVRLLKEQQISEGVIRLAGLLRIPAELADPVLTGAQPPFAPGLTREYYAFIDASMSKLPVTLDDPAALKLPRRELQRYWANLAERSRPQADVLRFELFQGGRVVDHRKIDFRNPVFAVAQISYSRAVTAVAATWSALWREAHGDTTRMRGPRELTPEDRGPSEPLGPPLGPPQSESLDAGMERPWRAARMAR